MKIPIMTAILGLPLIALGQTAEPQQSQAQTKETQTQTTAPTKGKTRPEQEQTTKPQAKPGTEKTTNVQDRDRDINRNEPGTRSSTTEKNVKTTVNREEFRSRHSEVFSLGRHPKEFFIQRFGENHFRLIGNSYFVFVDGCWVAVDVDGFTYSERLICAGDPEFIEVE